jgi:hypothetical protein
MDARQSPLTPDDDPARTKLDLETRKLRVELAVAETQLGRLGTFNRLVWPTLSTSLTVIISLSAFLFSLYSNYQLRQAQRSQDAQRVFSEKIAAATATDKGPASQIGAIWVLNSFWRGTTYDQELVEALSPLLLSNDAPVRAAAAEVLGNAIQKRPSGAPPYDAGASWDHSVWVRRTRLLYGYAPEGELGAVMRTQFLVAEGGKAGCTGAPTRAPLLEQQLASIGEAVRKNWEDLESSNLAAMDLRGIKLYESHLEHASLMRTNLREADLRGAFLTGASFWDACLDSANIKDVDGTPSAPPHFREWALGQGAVEMDDSAFADWREKRFPKPADWNTWSRAGFATNEGCPAVPLRVDAEASCAPSKSTVRP